MTKRQLDALITELRERHPELRRPLTWHGLRRVLERDHIRLVRETMAGHAEVISQNGHGVIGLNATASAGQGLRWTAHEYAHTQLHFREQDEGELVFHVMPALPGDVREREADYLSECLLAGPDVEVPWQEVKRRRPPEVTEGGTPPTRRRPVAIVTPLPVLPPTPRAPRPRVFLSFDRAHEDGLHHAIRVAKKFRRFR